MKVNYKSDFKLTEVSEEVDLTTPFRFRYSTVGDKNYWEASFDGVDQYTNCTRLDDGSLLIVFQEHGLYAGQLLVCREYYLTDTDFANDTCKRVVMDKLDIFLTAGKGDTVDITITLMPAYIKGEPGASAYEVAVENGYEGTVSEWLESLIGGEDYTPNIDLSDYYTAAEVDSKISDSLGDIETILSTI